LTLAAAVLLPPAPLDMHQARCAGGPQELQARCDGKRKTEMTALFALGFRPFYLLAGLYAAVSVPLWAAQYAGWLPGANPLWHAHEMLFGYAFAVIAGFLFTAARNWTGRPTPSGGTLAAIAALWVAARVLAFLWSAAASWADAAFAVAVAWGIGGPILSSGNRNWFFIPLVLALGAASIAFQIWPRIALSAGLDVVLFIIALMGGRVIPAFTNSAVPGAGARSVRVLELAALGSLLLLLALDLAEAPAAALVALAAAALHGARLALWAPLRTRGRPILWILHVAYAWIVAHLALRGLAGWDLVAPALATHALTIGGIGGLTLGMMTRTARGHTGRPLQAGRAEVWAYVLVQGSALLRVLVPILAPQAYAASVAASAALWSAAFALFCIAYAPILSRPRIDGRPG
jgi:uncharacterized protein involved in response to NO